MDSGPVSSMGVTFFLGNDELGMSRVLKLLPAMSVDLWVRHRRYGVEVGLPQ